MAVDTALLNVISLLLLNELFEFITEFNWHNLNVNGGEVVCDKNILCLFPYGQNHNSSIFSKQYTGFSEYFHLSWSHFFPKFRNSDISFMHS